MKNILITGSSGFLGINLVNYLKDYSLFSFSRKYGSNYDIINQKYLTDNKIDVVIHLLGLAHDLKNINNHQDYYRVNTEFTINIFDSFLQSNTKIFIFISSVKAVADSIDCELTETYLPQPVTHYGKSKLLAEEYILSKEIQEGKRIYILRPCMIHGPGNKGNLNLLYSIISKGLPWPLGAFHNKRSFCSVDNLCFIINELINNDNIPSGIYNIADDVPLSTNELIGLISESQDKNIFIWNFPKFLIRIFSKMGDLFMLPINTERLNKLTETYIVSNLKIIKAMNKPLPINSKDGLLKTFDSFNK